MSDQFYPIVLEKIGDASVDRNLAKPQTVIDALL